MIMIGLFNLRLIFILIVLFDRCIIMSIFPEASPQPTTTPQYPTAPSVPQQMYPSPSQTQAPQSATSFYQPVQQFMPQQVRLKFIFKNFTSSFLS